MHRNRRHLLPSRAHEQGASQCRTKSQGGDSVKSPWVNSRAGVASLRAIAAGIMLLLFSALMPAETGAGGGPLTYAYDALGRLVAVVDGSGNAAHYFYDPVGNITEIDPPAHTVAIFAFSPNNGPAGQNLSVTIYGDWFSTTPSQNTVTFNGTAAAVSASTIATITTTVPAGATTGPIQVTVSGVGSATSSQNFKVTAN